MRIYLLAGAIVGAIVIAALLAIVEPPRWTIPATEEPLEGVGAADDHPQLATLALHTIEGSLLDMEDDASDLIGRNVELIVDIGLAANDVAFWTGTPPDDLLVVMNRGTRSGWERRRGLPSEFFGPLPWHRRALVTGTVEPVPYPEAMYSWGLTKRDKALLAQRGAYVLIDGLVALPGTPPDTAPPDATEWGRTTAPPAGEQVETPLGLPPPLP